MIFRQGQGLGKSVPNILDVPHAYSGGLCEFIQFYNVIPSCVLFNDIAYKCRVCLAHSAVPQRASIWYLACPEQSVILP